MKNRGRFTDYLASLKKAPKSSAKSDSGQSTSQSDSASSSQDAPASNAKTKKKLTYSEKIEYDHIEDDIEKLESQVEDIDKQMQNNGSDYDKLADLQAQKDQLSAEADKKMKRWEYLSEYAE